MIHSKGDLNMWEIFISNACFPPEKNNKRTNEMQQGEMVRGTPIVFNPDLSHTSLSKNAFHRKLLLLHFSFVFLPVHSGNIFPNPERAQKLTINQMKLYMRTFGWLTGRSYIICMVLWPCSRRLKQCSPTSVYRCFVPEMLSAESLDVSKLEAHTNHQWTDIRNPVPLRHEIIRILLLM